tara:strand:- start:272 stop:466 length:195 start_codon:yes stop_codon:yes gene_type:complete
MEKEFKKPLTAEELSKIIGCTPQHIYQMAQRDQIPHFRLGSHVRFPADVIETHILKGTNNENEV